LDLDPTEPTKLKIERSPGFTVGPFLYTLRYIHAPKGDAVPDFLSEKRHEISSRLAELKPRVEEYRRLEAAAQALNGIPGAPARTAPVNGRRGPGRPRGSGTKPTTKRATSAAAAAPGAKPVATKRPGGRRPGRRKGSGSRAAQTQSLVTEQPGITIPELAVKMGIKQNYLYRVLPGLEQEKKVQKKGRGWYPVAA